MQLPKKELHFLYERISNYAGKAKKAAANAKIA